MWKTIQCAVPGRAHEQYGIPCQDKTYSDTKNGVSATALCDGAGSVIHAEAGAACISEFICHDLTKSFDSYYEDPDGFSVKTALDQKLKNRIKVLAAEMQCTPKDLSTTLLAVAVKDDRFLLVHVGDGVIGYTKDHKTRVASRPFNGEYANMTVFVTSETVARTMHVIKGTLNGIDGFILMSDGSAASLYDKRQKLLSSGLGRIMQMIPWIPTEILETQLHECISTSVRDATTDDCSIAFTCACPEEPKGFMSLDNVSKAKLLDIEPYSKSWRKKLHRSEMLLCHLTQAMPLEKISRLLHLKPQYTGKYLTKLLELNWIEKQNSLYQTIIRIN